MTNMPSDNDDLIRAAEASDLLGVPADRVEIMVDEGLLTPAEGAGADARFRRSEVLALREQGG